MSVTIASLSFLGILVDSSVIESEKLVKAFPHDFSEDVNFHPKNGRELWRKEKVYFAAFVNVPGTSTSEDLRFGWDDSRSPKLAGYPVLRPYYSHETISQYAIALEYVYSKSEWNQDYLTKSKSFDLSSLPGKFAQFKEVLSNLGVWNNSFGFYTTPLFY